MLKKLSIILLLAAAVSCTVKQRNFDKAKLDSFFNALSVHNKNMGSMVISSNGVVVYQKVIGYSQVNGDVKTPATVKTKYCIGSISKMFTATMIFQLIEEGKLSLTMPLSKYFPQLPNAAKITIGEMLDHRSGLYNFTNDSLYITYRGQPKTEAELVAIFAKEKPEFEPDAKADYSNTNFVLLGYIVEKITGKPYKEELQKRIALKIGLTDTYYGGKTNPANNEAYSYLFVDKWNQMPETDMSIPGGAGAIVSTPTDLVKFIEALFGGRLISQSNLELMKKQNDNYGMAMFKFPFGDEIAYGHGGRIDGFTSMLVYFPDDKLAMAYTANGMGYSTNDVMLAAYAIYSNKPFIIPHFKTIRLKTEDLDKYLGNYTSTAIPIKMTVTKNNATLLIQGGGDVAYPVEPTSPDKFVFSESGATLEFEPAKNSFTLLQGGKTYYFTKVK